MGRGHDLTTISMTKSGVAERLAAVVGDNGVATDGDLTARYRIDWLGRYDAPSVIVVRPDGAAQVAAVLGICSETNTPVVPQGGNTGLVGGSVPTVAGSVVLSTERMLHLGPLDETVGRITVGAGVTVAALAAHLRGTGWEFAVDLGSRDRATIGGLVATNAGGTRVFRYGSTRRQVDGLEAVLADGSIISHLGGLTKDNTGYDLDGLLCGSEGTLGVVTTVGLRLIRERSQRVTALVGFDSERSSIDAAWELRNRCRSVEVVEFIDSACVAEVVAGRDVADPVPGASGFLLVESADDTDPSEDLAECMDSLRGVVGAAIADTAQRRRALWDVRELIVDHVARRGELAKYDVSVPPGELVRFCDEVRALVQLSDPTARPWIFGHVCDDNLHVNVTRDYRPPSGTTDDGWRRRLDAAVYGLVRDRRGSISAEHGIGRTKLGVIGLSRTDAELAAMANIKRALDPSNVLNPGVLVDLSRATRRG